MNNSDKKPPQIRTILGIDPGTGRLGWGIICKTHNSQLTTRRSDSAELVDCGVLETAANTPLSDRLEFIFNGLQEVIEKYQPTELAIEELFFVKNVKTGISVAHARGVAMLAAKLAKMSIDEYKPNEIKLGICGYGHADKKQMQKMVELHIRGCKIKQDDTADAVAVALYHLQVRKLPNSPESQPELAPERTNELPNSPEIKPELALEKDNKILYKLLSYSIVGVLYDCFNQLGGGLQERYYQSFTKELLVKRGIKFEDQKKLTIRGLPSYLGRFFPDFIVDDRVILELKVGTRVKKQDIDQVMTYLRQSGKELAIIALFSQNGVDTRRLLLGYSGDNSRK